MGRILDDVLGAGRDAILVISVLAMLAYTKWHYWWRTGWGRARMTWLLSIAALTLSTLLGTWTKVDYDFSSIPDDAIAAVDVAAVSGVLVAVTYMLFRIAAFNVRRVRDPYYAILEARRHIERTPGASREEIEKLLDYWDETHTYQRITRD